MKKHLLCLKHLETKGPTIHVASVGVAVAAAHGMSCSLVRYSIQHSLTVRNEDRGDNSGRPTHITKMESIQVIEECQTPPAEEILSWAQNFDKMMKTPAGRNIFREFLRTEYSEENLLFWLACEDLKKEQNKEAIEEKARLIYEDYISILSPKEVSLDSRVREVINRNLLDPNPHMYEDAQLQIYTLMHRDSFPRFLNSQIYKSLLESTTGSTSET
ncbi:regulator of G-protein signaling 17 isoform X1 [Sceloporus undulatus]|uniref:regulator of G-protein signaling 17 isoform X1 n=1 Tax=Sceloporus undulatus TaxID=8520 RepID=UPI001C4BBBEC|nr:regulator of G-protein signaling 17 isoform X1 [Sceloporus undulatus]XP_042301902.1 regulator of G-protein signaling 17 isoform X1 [Sceloporus undulatus]